MDETFRMVVSQSPTDHTTDYLLHYNTCLRTHASLQLIIVKVKFLRRKKINIKNTKKRRKKIVLINCKYKLAAQHVLLGNYERQNVFCNY